MLDFLFGERVVKTTITDETLEDKLQSLVVKWHQRQLHYQDVAEDNITHEHTNRKFTYKAMATRDCWKELLTLLNESKNE